MRKVVWGYGRSWIAKWFDADGNLVRVSRWFTSKRQADDET